MSRLSSSIESGNFAVAAARRVDVVAHDGRAANRELHCVGTAQSPARAHDDDDLAVEPDRLSGGYDGSFGMWRAAATNYSLTS